MAQPIIFDDFARQLRANAAAAPWEAAGAAVQGVTHSIDQALFDYQQRKQREKEVRLSASTVLANKYGFDALGPDFTHQWEKDTGVQFPRNPDGTPRVPRDYEGDLKQKTAKLTAEALQDPEKRDVIIGLAKPPMSKDEKYYKDQDLALAHEENRMKERIYSLDAAVKMAALRRDTGPSGFEYNPQTRDFDYVGAGKGMSNMDMDNAKVAITSHLTELDRKWKKAQVMALIHKSQSGDILDKALIPAMNAFMNPKTKTRERIEALKVIQTIAGMHGKDLPLDTPEDVSAFRGILNELRGASKPGGTASSAGAQERPATPDQELNDLEKHFHLGGQ